MKKIHRYLSFFLCLALILFCISSPFRQSASASATATVAIAVGGGASISVAPAIAVVALVLVAVGFATGSIQNIYDEAVSFYNSASAQVKEWFTEAGEALVSGKEAVKIPEIIRIEIDEDLARKQFQEPKRIPANMPYLLIPPSLLNLDTVTETDAFAQDVVGAVERGNALQEITNTRLLTLYGLLNTSFADIEDFVTTQTSAISTGFSDLTSNLGSKISSLSTTLSGKLDSVESATDAMSSTVSGHLKDLKTLYSSFGNATLGKFDSLITSIEGISFPDLSTDFSHLKELYSQIGNATLDKIETAIGRLDLIPDSIYTAAESLSTSLTNSFDQGFTSLSDALSNISVEATLPGVSESLISIDSISGEILSGIRDLASVFTSDDFSLALSDVSLSAESLSSLNDVVSSFQTDILEPYIDFVYGSLTAFDPIVSSLDSLSFTLDDFLFAFESLETDFLDPWFASFSQIIENISMLSNDFYYLTLIENDFLATLSDIKISIQSIAGTTTANPNPGGNSSQDEYEKEKAPLMPWVGSGFEIGGSYFNSIQGFLGDDMDAFLVAGMIFEEFAGMTFFYKLIIISCSVGLIGTLLGMALQLQGYSVAQRRREEAAQSKAHNRMERSYAA